jgi:DnaJ-domain-containing protein 1
MLASSAVNVATQAAARVRSALRRSYESWSAAADVNGADANLGNMLAVVHALLAETELLVAGTADLLLRDVLQSEFDGLRERGADLARRVRRVGAERANAMLRSLTRDLDRIMRIAHGAARRAEDEELIDAEAPASVFEAYRILGLNPEAPYVAVKKVVDALRMSWHPDHARDEMDRLFRERRIKQINAAWDLLKSGRAATARPE